MTALTARNLRTALFWLDNQEMTVKELRAILFNFEKQDAELELDFSMWVNLEAEAKAEAERETEFYG